MIELMGFALICAGVLGYSFRPPSEYVGSGKLLKSLALYYLILSFLLLAETVSSFMNLAFEIILSLVLLLLSIYGIVELRRFWEFKFERIKEILLYGSVVYLMDYHISSVSLSWVLRIVSLVLLVWIAVISIYVVFRLERLKVFVAFENYELVSIAYFIVLLIGLCDIANRMLDTLPYALTTVLTLYSLYVIGVRYMRPLLE